MRTEHDETARERLGDACIGIVALLVLGVLMVGWL